MRSCSFVCSHDQISYEQWFHKEAMSFLVKSVIVEVMLTYYMENNFIWNSVFFVNLQLWKCFHWKHGLFPELCNLVTYLAKFEKLMTEKVCWHILYCGSNKYLGAIWWKSSFGADLTPNNELRYWNIYFILSTGFHNLESVI